MSLKPYSIGSTSIKRFKELRRDKILFEMKNT